MRRRKLYPALALAMLCVLLAGCVYNTSDTVIHDDASGTVDYVDAIIMDEGEELEEGNKIYEYNGNKYQGAPQSYAFSSAEEFNKLFTVSSEDEEASDGSISGNTIPATLSKNGDGSLTLVVGVTALKTEEEEAEAAAEANTEAAAEAGSEAAAEAGSEAADGDEDISEEDAMAMAESMMESVYMRYTFAFDRPVRQLSGDTEGVTIEGGKITINILSVQDISADLVFTTSSSATPPAPAEKPTVVLSPQKLAVNGAAKETEIYNIDGTNYFKLRDLAMLLNGTGSQFSVAFDGTRNTVVVKTGEAYAPVGGELATGTDNAASAVVSPQSIEIDGKTAALTAYNIGGANFFGLRALEPYLGYTVGWDAAANTATITSK